MKFLIYFFAIYCFFCIQTVEAADPCRSGESRLKESEPCIPNHLRNYLYCLITSGGGKIEVKEKNDTAQSKNFEINIEGNASGIVMKGKGSGGFKQSESNRVVKEINLKIDPSLASLCKSMSMPIFNPVPPKDKKKANNKATTTASPKTSKNLVSDLFFKVRGAVYYHDSTGKSIIQANPFKFDKSDSNATIWKIKNSTYTVLSFYEKQKTGTESKIKSNFFSVIDVSAKEWISDESIIM